MVTQSIQKHLAKKYRLSMKEARDHTKYRDAAHILELWLDVITH